MEEHFIKELYLAHTNALQVPSPEEVSSMLNGLLKMLFPELSDKQFANYRAFKNHFYAIRLELNTILTALHFDLTRTPEQVEDAFLARLPAVRQMIIKDAEAILEGDPAATNLTEVIRTYPGFLAVAIFRIAHEFHRLKVPLIPRILTEHAHRETGVDIHPGAKIGLGFCIDHGTGIVIGETTEIGDYVKIYQGVTLGALSVEKHMAKTKRHPTIEDRVVIYAGATILGGRTIIGHDSVIGGNAWITRSVPPFSKVYYEAKNLQSVK